MFVDVLIFDLDTFLLFNLDDRTKLSKATALLHSLNRTDFDTLNRYQTYRTHFFGAHIFPRAHFCVEWILNTAENVDAATEWVAHESTHSHGVHLSSFQCKQVPHDWVKHSINSLRPRAFATNSPLSATRSHPNELLCHLIRFATRFDDAFVLHALTHRRGYHIPLNRDRAFFPEHRWVVVAADGVSMNFACACLCLATMTKWRECALLLFARGLMLLWPYLRMWKTNTTQQMAIRNEKIVENMGVSVFL